MATKSWLDKLSIFPLIVPPLHLQNKTVQPVKYILPNFGDIITMEEEGVVF